MKTNVLIVGSGGREHAIAWKLAQSPRIGRLFIAPGNGGTQQFGQNIAMDATDIDKLLDFARANHVNLTFVGPEESLQAGIVDAFQAEKLRIFGPTRLAAEIETSKAYSKRSMRMWRIPTAKFDVVSDHDQALSVINERGYPLVIKASGLAGGKAAYVCRTMEQAEQVLWDLMVDFKHDDAGQRVIIEDFLAGQEISLHALSDGKTSVLFPPAQDHKPIGENDQGKNTGGMGTIIPIPSVSDKMLAELNKRVVAPTLWQMQFRNREFRGLLFPGLMMTAKGPMVLEFNARFGDPETQSYMRLLKTDLLDILEACVDGTLAELKIEWKPGFAVCIVLASAGYPDKPITGLPIQGISEAEKQRDIVVFHAGTEFDNELRTSGGRVLGVTATGKTLKAALDKAYAAIPLIHFEGMQYRRDIGAKSLQAF